MVGVEVYVTILTCKKVNEERGSKTEVLINRDQKHPSNIVQQFFVTIRNKRAKFDISNFK